jgi:hypothetical protein
MPVIPVFRRHRQKDHKLKASLGDPVSKAKQNKKK